MRKREGKERRGWHNKLKLKIKTVQKVEDQGRTGWEMKQCKNRVDDVRQNQAERDSGGNI